MAEENQPSKPKRKLTPEEISEKQRMTPEEKQALMKEVPEPDRYILLGSSCTKTPEEITAHYKKTKDDADERVKELGIVDDKITPEQLDAFAKQYTEQLIASLMSNPKVAKDGKCIFCLGGPGSGKSTICRNLEQTHLAYHADADAIKNELAKALEIDINGPSMHGYSGEIMKNYVIPALIENHINFIQEKIGDEIYKMIKYANEYREQGCETSMVLVHCPTDVCRERNIARCEGFMRNGQAPRLVADENVLNIGTSPLETYMYLMHNYGELFETGTAYCSDTTFDKFPLHLQGMDYEHGKRVENAQTEEHIRQGKHFKSTSVKCQGQRYLATHKIHPKLAEEIQRGIDELASTGKLEGKYSAECLAAMGEINDEAVSALIDVLNPTRNYIGREKNSREEEQKNYNIEQVDKDIQDYAEQQKQNDLEAQKTGETKKPDKTGEERDL